MKQRYWTGHVGKVDSFFDPIVDTFIDGATIRGWAIMTPASHAEHGMGLGMGKGQKYQKQTDGRWLKVEG